MFAYSLVLIKHDTDWENSRQLCKLNEVGTIMARTQRNIVTSQLCLQTPMKARLSANNNERTILAISQKDIH